VWGTTWRVGLALLVGLLAFAVVRGWEITAFDEAGVATDTLGGLIALDMLFGLVAIGLLPLRRRSPLPIAIAVGVLGSVSALACGAIAVAVISLATRRRKGEIGVAAVVLVAPATAVEAVVASTVTRAVFDPSPLWQVFLLVAAMYGLLIGAGLYIGGRRELLAALEERAKFVEEEQALRLQNARAGERERIAREMHDVLAHRLSLVALHSGALAYRDNLTHDETAATAEVVRDNARLALSELRQVLGEVRDPVPGEGPVSSSLPQPTLAGIATLVAENRAAGVDVRCDIRPGIAKALDTLPVAQSRHAYRIIQESLTNARKHTPGAPVEVELAGAAGERLEIVVRNAVGVAEPAPGGGLGLAGLEERAALAGGGIRHGLENGDFIVRAWLPWSM